MKKYIFSVWIPALSFFLFLSTGCSKEITDTNPGDFTSQVKNLPLEPLSADESASLLFMREEEKLARDVYVYLYYRWSQFIFSNISTAEETHMDAVLLLLNKYKLADPVAVRGYGEFANPLLQTLYDQLSATGYVSAFDALKTGASIEELDLYDLNNALKITDNQDITLVYKNLARGSRNHLRSFYAAILDAEGSYSPRYLSQAEFDAIVNSPMEKGYGTPW